MGTHDPIAYTFEADYYCPSCTEERFGRCACGFIACPGEGYKCTKPPLDIRDGEGNEVGIVAPWDEWHEPSEPTCQTLACGTCGTELDTMHADPHSRDCGNWEAVEPAPEDYIVTPTGPLGSLLGVGIVEGPHLGEYPTHDDAYARIREDAEERRFYPDVWFISDHGNAHIVSGEVWKEGESASA